VQNVPEVTCIYCASAYPASVVLADNGEGRAIIGVIDGLKPKGVEADEDIAWRKDFLRKIGYKTA
jgi:adenosine/AMP kinase